MRVENHSFVTKKAQAKIAQVLEAVASTPMTRDELQCLLGISKPTMRRYITHLCAEPRRIYVSAWRRTTGQPAPVYSAGDRCDKKPPRPMTRTERNKEEWRRIKADPERHDRVRAYQRTYGAIQRLRGKPQPWFAALMTSTQQSNRSTAP